MSARRDQVRTTGGRRRTLVLLMALQVAVGATSAAQPAAVGAGFEPVPTARTIADPLSPRDRVSLLFDWDTQIGGFDEGRRQTLTLRSSFAFDLGGGGRLVWQANLPALRQTGYPREGTQDPDVSGLGDLDQTLLYVPARVRDARLQWGIGIAARLPTATQDGLGRDRAAVGPALALRWHGTRWSTGVQFAHHQELSGDGQARHQTRVQPFVARDLGESMAVGIDIDAAYDSDRDSLKGPMTVYWRKAFPSGHARAWALDAGVRYWPDGPTAEPEWGLRLGLTRVFD